MINIPWTEGWNYAYEMEKKPRGFGSCCRSDRRTEREWRRVEVWKKTMDWKLAKEEKRKCNAFSLLSIFIRAGSTRQPWFIWRRAWPAWPSHCSPYQRGLQGKSTRNAKYVTTLPSTYYYILVSKFGYRRFFYLNFYYDKYEIDSLFVLNIFLKMCKKKQVQLIFSINIFW